MAKDKKEKEKEKEDKPVDFRKSVLALIEKNFGQNLVKTGTEFLIRENAKKIISVCPSLDVGSGGGIPEGSWLVFAGKQKCGKTVTTLHFVKKCQDAGKHVYYLNIEGRLKKMNLIGTFGLREDMLDVIESTEEKTLHTADWLNIAENIIRSHPGCVIVFDSYSMLCPEAEQTGGVGTSTMGSPAALLAQFFRQMAGVVPAKKTIVVGINQLMANIGWGKSGTTEKGGSAIQYQSDIKFRHKMSESWKEGDKVVGTIVTWVVEWNALGNGAIPGSEVKSYLRYGHGIDEVQELIDIGTDVGFIEQAGAWYTLSYMENYLTDLGVEKWDEETMKKCKAQGSAKLCEMLRSNPKWLELLRKEVSQMLGI